MELVEFDSAIEKFKEAWPRSMTPARASQIYRKWEKLPKGIFSTAIDALIYNGGHPPSGSDIDETIVTILQGFNQKMGKIPEKVYKGCELCGYSGILQIANVEGYETICACGCDFGQYRQEQGTKPLQIAKSLGYTKIKEPLSYRAKKHRDWIDANTAKYGSLLVGVYNTVQRTLLTNDSRGLKGINDYAKISSDNAFKIYELMMLGNTEHELIKKHNKGLSR